MSFSYNSSASLAFLPKGIATIDAGGPYEGKVDQQITLSAAGCYDADGFITSYEWDFESDGVYDLKVSHFATNYTFDKPLSGKLTLRVTDNEGNTGTDTTNITIVKPADLRNLLAILSFPLKGLLFIIFYSLSLVFQQSFIFYYYYLTEEKPLTFGIIGGIVTIVYIVVLVKLIKKKIKKK
ncbi:PKD domain-containing protein [Patescibacteria group bacterium]